ncbi:helix-turn-helix transcriptional regulator [Lysinibacillus sp. ZYM-1]|uniref:helix-turn-helix transcriptional regulator n=1 Tax=Lysinibacillus sp. ZYM-1 TaxID=1681184 RepID=UPI0006CE994E|nr:helix-turn-helix domain-containing protein [Lysinibacillus sp. ZYM-1]KPN97741.1 hypothetical protein AO843_11265 [Lysinibacillus sp. ZYM-1]
MVDNKLKELRLRRGISISELARRSGLNRVTISNIENKRVIPTLESAFAISRELETQIEVIFFEIGVNHDLLNGKVVTNQ